MLDLIAPQATAVALSEGSAVGIGVGVMIFQLIFFVIVVAAIIYGVLDVLKKPDAAWQASGQNKVVSIVLIVLLGLVGLAIYWFAFRPKVVEAANRLDSGN